MGAKLLASSRQPLLDSAWHRDVASWLMGFARSGEVLCISRGSVYYLPRPVPEADLAIMRRLDRLHLEFPFPEQKTAAREVVGHLRVRKQLPLATRKKPRICVRGSSCHEKFRAGDSPSMEPAEPPHERGCNRLDLLR
jgi:hypothetical protein